MTTPIVVNFFGAPSTGKSFNAMSLTILLKQLGYKAEYVAEYAKDLVSEGSEHKLKYQVYVFAKQLKRLEVLVDKGLDFIVTDSPILLSSMYGEYYKTSLPSFTPLVLDHYQLFNNFNILLSSTLKYDEALRVQSQEEAVVIQKRIESFLDGNSISYVNFENSKSNNYNSIIETLTTLVKG